MGGEVRELEAEERDPYVVGEGTAEEPPATFLGRLRHLGPGLVLSASIVGSGELIATTVLGAKAGFVCLWVIIVSCLVKVMLQIEFGRHAIHTGETTMASFSRLPGPRLGTAGWAVWTWFLMLVGKFVQMGGILGAVAIALQIAVPSVPAPAWTGVAAVAAALLVFRGRYRLIEGLSLAMIGIFSVITMVCLVSLQATEAYAVSWADLAQGMSFGLPAEAVIFAVGAFGITGVGADEISQYPYWCIEKGYAAWTGPRADDPAWVERARGWIRVMYVDAFVSMVLYTAVTAAFYLLGASVLHRMGVVPEGAGVIETLSIMYTEALGQWASVVFLVGAFVVLFSTLFAALAGWTRTLADALGQMGLIDFQDAAVRRRTVAVLAWVIPLVWAALCLTIGAPVAMVVTGGMATALMLILVIFAAIHYRYRRLIPELRPGALYDVGFWLSAVAIAGVGAYSIYSVL